MHHPHWEQLLRRVQSFRSSIRRLAGTPLRLSRPGWSSPSFVAVAHRLTEFYMMIEKEIVGSVSPRLLAARPHALETVCRMNAHRRHRFRIHIWSTEYG